MSKITGHSRTSAGAIAASRTRARPCSPTRVVDVGHDIVAYLQALRAEAGLPALPEQDVLEAMVVIEDAWLAAQNAFEAA